MTVLRYQHRLTKLLLGLHHDLMLWNQNGPLWQLGALREISLEGMTLVALKFYGIKTLKIKTYNLGDVV